MLSVLTEAIISLYNKEFLYDSIRWFFLKLFVLLGSGSGKHIGKKERKTDF